MHVALRDVKDKQKLWVGQTVTFLNGHYGRAIEVEVEVERRDKPGWVVQWLDII